MIHTESKGHPTTARHHCLCLLWLRKSIVDVPRLRVDEEGYARSILDEMERLENGELCPTIVSRPLVDGHLYSQLVIDFVSRKYDTRGA